MELDEAQAANQGLEELSLLAQEQATAAQKEVELVSMIKLKGKAPMKDTP